MPDNADRVRTNIYTSVGFVKLPVTVLSMTQPASIKSAGVGYAKGRVRRQEIIRTASKQFAEKGFGAATILEIAAECHISRAGLLHYFADKEALLAAVLEDRDAEDRHRFRPYARISGGLGILIGMVDLADHNKLVPGLIELFVRLSTEASAPSHPAHEYFVERYRRIRTGTAGAFRAAREAGHLRANVDPDDAGVRLTALMDGLQAQWLMDNRLDMAAHVDAAIRDVLSTSGEAEYEAARHAMVEDSPGYRDAVHHPDPTASWTPS
jgi:AcrR family transcriptional regulator